MNAPEGEDHLGPEDLGLLAEGRLPPATREPAIRHLARCRACMAAYADAVRYRAAWLARPEEFLPADAPPRAAPAAGAPGRFVRTTAPRSSSWLALAAGVAVALVAWRGGWLGGSPRGDVRVPAAIRAVLDRASTRDLILPGALPRAAGPRYRSGEPADDLDFRVVLGERMSAYERGDRGIENTYAVAAGQLAAGHLETARGLLREGLAAHPDAPRLRVLSAVLAYRENRLGDSEAQLIAARRLAPEDPVAAFDLALVLLESGRANEGRTMLERLLASRPPAPIAERARAAIGGR